MATFMLYGQTYEYLTPSGGSPEEAQSWTYGEYPKVSASVPLAGGGTVSVYAEAQRWTNSHILTAWKDDHGDGHWAWIPKENIRRVTDSEWDIEEYRRCPEHLCGVRWGKRLPGFLPE